MPPGAIPDDPELIRSAHLITERNVRAVGRMNLLLALWYFLASLWSAFWIVATSDDFTPLVHDVGGWVACIACLIAGRALYRLQPNSRNWGLSMILVAGVCGIGSLFPAALVGFYTITGLLGEKAKTVLSPAYREIIAATPEMTGRPADPYDPTRIRPTIPGALLVALVAVILSVMIFALIFGRGH